MTVMPLEGAELTILGELVQSGGELDDSELATRTGIGREDLKDGLSSLRNRGYADFYALNGGGLKASATVRGRIEFRLEIQIRTTTATKAPAPVATGVSRQKPDLRLKRELVGARVQRTGREKALVVGVSDYPPPIRR